MKNTTISRRNLLKAAILSAIGASSASSLINVAQASVGFPEKEELKLGFIKLTDMAPLAIAYEKGFFEDEGLYVTLEAQANWRVLVDGVVSGALDGAHMLPGQAIAATIGYGNNAELITPFSMDLNGNAITVSNSIWNDMRPYIKLDENDKPIHPISAKALIPAIENLNNRGESFRMGMVFPVSTHNYELRYWLAAGGIHPGFYAPDRGDTSGTIDSQAQLSVTPPPQMPATMDAGTIHGYCVGEPWNQQAVFRNIGVPVISNNNIWRNNPEKVFGMRKDFYEQYPNTTIRMVKALLRAARWLDENDNANRKEAVKILARPIYVGADEAVIANSMTGTFEYEKGDQRSEPDFNIFFRNHATYPFYSDAVWFLTQMRRWGQISEQKSDDWYHEIAQQVYRPDIYQIAANELIKEGKFTASEFPDFSIETGFKPATDEFIDGITYDGLKPNDYLKQFEIGLKGADKV
ncbi:CmpA/NrtA family ABC transporter substrate-binding protein [Thiomicrospira cyclica]|uniref:ABC-type nitrate/sulfonate/bicarbonate transport system, periplasmic component n=1 Tax=Thiomicrospira cyclica (strain DSM 14477 / JCM 11371 / ALM1) TaxID=717773 RepID=F6DCG4_THICA|nr:CmpA/NrtA family ABC transporter substrate-binding protein [Thiomicrospira cyclica]AEG31550.1 ABC-type nitrate/sulfonate/bicarbonate transport system, periplasmic component [Thiomicrospira cyclica ALM1]